MTLLLLSFVAGLLTILSPCVVTLVPIMLSTTLGRDQKRPLLITAGMIVSFTFFGMVFSFSTSFLGLSKVDLKITAVVLLFVFGVFMLFPVLWDHTIKLVRCILLRSNPATTKSKNKDTPWGAFLVGLSLGLIWAPCAGPILGSVLAVSLQKSQWLYSTLLFVSYSAGAGLPILLIGYGSSTVTQKIRSLARYSHTIQRIAGGLLMITAIGLWLDWDQRVQTFLVEHGPDFTGIEQWLDEHWH